MPIYVKAFVTAIFLTLAAFAVTANVAPLTNRWSKVIDILGMSVVVLMLLLGLTALWLEVP